ncbi:hypothetical protein RchiOBHm_Chr1g0383181 [Rosa chinensis]|uniref:Uncharacterized protein n=1 Tax=Rosa chinensis TaxID=74649 RepID=A0A2P6SPM2_ROSCH|nr:hypothetical protein RchiOBHm_Chr1g0383181 [Rosa chinensis]
MTVLESLWIMKGQAEEILGNEGKSYHDGGPWRGVLCFASVLAYGAIFEMKCSALRT